MATLKYPPFKANATINEVANGRQTLKRGSQGEAVRLVQKALIDLAFSMPSGADGSFGGQTHAAVVQFQNKWGLTADGICGRETVAVLDVSIATHHGFIPNPTPQPVPASELQTLRFWINAFIPDPSISPDVKPAPGASAGGSMVTVPWPFNAYLKRCCK
ncbi:hypothetical protein CC86DRAFT_10753 [Ophiobolus disseminans]|uniref:Peptidoglycan binding-like domain-containing protein n=1 Tax=Ophiobolus disseminans TaxID=1469910 RepID=A0A6A7ALC8_9PLEO|nr:hypothetical protein CC86DRAFT_10753 [Ophiobolus disseminans]